MLFVIDNSISMSEEQRALTAQLNALFTALTEGRATGATFPIARSLNVGVVSTDLGSGGHMVATCTNADFGDDGVLQHRGDPEMAGCLPSYPSFLRFNSGGGDPATLADDLTCVASLGAEGCGFGQPLDAMLKAVTPSTSSIEFVGGTLGHGEGENTGFIRSDALLVVVVMTDADDCSASDTDLFNASSTTYVDEIGLRCALNPEAHHPIQRYVDGLRELKGDARLLLFAALAGVPPHLVESYRGTDFDGILSDDAMQERVDVDFPNRLIPSCSMPETVGLAFPPRRLVTLARDLEAIGAAALVRSLCLEDYTQPIDSVAIAIGDVLARDCE